jgi:hypothetical protein
MIAVPSPDVPDASKAEIEVKLATPLRGKPEIGQNIRWQGVPVAFNKEPFLVTMDADAAGVDGVKLAACSAGRATAARATPARR